jgi:hypothetical protein
MIRAILLFLLFWVAWIIVWQVFFIVLDIGLGRAPLGVTVGAIVALLVTIKVLEWRKERPRWSLPATWPMLRRATGSASDDSMSSWRDYAARYRKLDPALQRQTWTTLTEEQRRFIARHFGIRPP